MNDQLIDKLRGHTDRLIDPILCEKYFLVDPMFFRKGLVQRFNREEKGRGFDLIRKTIYFNCIQDFANICFDKDSRTPSVVGVIEHLKDPYVQSVLRENYSHYFYVIKGTDPTIRASRERFQEKQRDPRRKNFDRNLKKLLNRWNAFRARRTTRAFKDIRDQITAHFQVKKVGDEYQFVNPASHAIRWSDLKANLKLLRGILESLNLVVRSSDFDLVQVVHGAERSGKLFWR